MILSEVDLHPDLWCLRLDHGCEVVSENDALSKNRTRPLVVGQTVRVLDLDAPDTLDLSDLGVVKSIAFTEILLPVSKSSSFLIPLIAFVLSSPI